MNTDLIPITIIPRGAALVIPAARAEIAARDARRARLAPRRARQDARQGVQEARGEAIGGGVDGFHVEWAGEALPGTWQARRDVIRAEKVARGECRASHETLMRVQELFGEGVGRG